VQTPATRHGPRSEPGARDRLALTQREAQVAGLIALGLQNKEIGERLGVSPATVKAHVRACLLKCGVTSRAGLAAWHVLGTRRDRSDDGHGVRSDS
jgi:DNA-binding NarL/FixJ family response regulator